MTIAAPLMCRMAVIDSIFNNATLKLMTNLKRDMLRKALVFILAEIVLMIIVSAVAPMDRTLMLLDEETYTFSYAVICRAHDDNGSSNGIVWITSVVALNIGVLCYGIYSAILIRNVSSVFGEAKWIGFVFYNLAVFGGIGLLLGAFADSDPSLQQTIIALMNLLACSGSTLIMWVPKYMMTGRIDKYVTPSDLARTIKSTTGVTNGTSATTMGERQNPYDAVVTALKRTKEIKVDDVRTQGKNPDDAIAAAEAFIKWMKEQL